MCDQEKGRASEDLNLRERHEGLTLELEFKFKLYFFCSKGNEGVYLAFGSSGSPLKEEKDLDAFTYSMGYFLLLKFDLWKLSSSIVNFFF